ncbi:hypothetical protein EIP91_007195 [Steccherinum ochraceum]|uniref:Uncharacterized protein n=1 Tax=Steccherinum ochraceum TaxID=92696 RepID=A0A4R0R720_9APHY|nr:hypothetical protein EIP91_007195 [Steccherinum ochraceum]
MNISPEPGSPISGSSSSDSETEIPLVSGQHVLRPRPGASWSMLSPSARPDLDHFSGPSGKRRNPPGPIGGGMPRDAKSRRREDGPGRRGGSGVNWTATPQEGGSKKDDLVDQHIVDRLRVLFGDPFDDSVVKVVPS